jgi:glycosyltransferase involved in cell wall biosynthesis
MLTDNKQSKSKIKVVFFISNFKVGGSEKSILNLLKNLNQDNFQKSLLLQKKIGDLIIEIPSDVLIRELSTFYPGSTLFSLIKYMYQEKPDIIMSVFPRLNIITILAKILSRSKTKIIISERSTFSRLSKYAAHKIYNKLISHSILPILAKIFYKRADLIICVSRGVADDISKIIGKLPSIMVIYNPVLDDNILEFIKEPLTSLNINNPSLPIILAVGRVTKAKDYPTMLKAFSIVLEEMPANLLIIGDGEDRKKIENIIKELDISKNVFLFGFQKNPLKYMAKADVFVLSSILEGFPNVLVEAMACGVPVVSTDCQSGPNEIIEDGKNGLLVPVGNEKAIAEAIVKLLENPELRKKFSEEGKKRAQYFSVEKSVKEFENIFKKVLAK